MERIEEFSRRTWGRITGAVYLLYFLTAILGQVIGRRYVAYGDAVNLVSDALYIAVTMLFYFMFRPVNRNLSLVAAIFSLAGCAITVLDVFHRAPSHISPLLFFGPYCLMLGYLIFRSTFLPRFLGVLLALAGVGWLIFLLPFAKHLSTYLEALGIIAEGSLCLWLVVMGVNVQRWEEQARIPGERRT
jgi:hypothetical protein